MTGKPIWDGLDVRVQKNWMFTSRWRHSTGFEEDNFIHVPLDTTKQLKALKPDIIFSYEMGMRSLLCSWYRRFNRQVPQVVVGNMSDHIEKERGLMRRLMRKLIRMNVCHCTYNGPSCKRYLESLGFKPNQLFHLPYCFDTESAYRGEKKFSSDGVTRISYAGAISQRKGVVGFTKQLSRWCESNPDRKVEFSFCGEGPLKSEVEKLARANLKLVFHGNCDNSKLKKTYSESDLFAFPTYADEWGLAPVEAMASGVPVLGSRYAQSMEELVVEGEGGWLFAPDDEAELFAAIECALATNPEALRAMGQKARNVVEPITPDRTAEKFCQIIQNLCKVSVSLGGNAQKSDVKGRAIYAD